MQAHFDEWRNFDGASPILDSNSQEMKRDRELIQLSRKHTENACNES